MSANRLDSRGNPIMSANGQVQVQQQQMQQQQQMPYSAGMQKGYGRFIDQQQQERHDGQDRNQQQDDGTPDDYFISELYQQLSQVINSKPTEVEPLRSGSYQILSHYLQVLYES
jgi:hypothetical protein